jgi:hypothetical protein
MGGREAKYRSGKIKKASGFLDGRSESNRAAREDKKAAGIVKTAAGKEKTRRGALDARFLTSEARREGGSDPDSFLFLLSLLSLLSLGSLLL